MDPRDNPLVIGEPAPWFHARSSTNPRFSFDSAAGRFVLLGFFGSAADADSQQLEQAVQEHRDLFDDERLSYFRVSHDPEDETQSRITRQMPGLRVFWDFDHAIAAGFGLREKDGTLRKSVYLLDPTLRVVSAYRLGGDTATSLSRLFQLLPTLPRFDPPHPVGAFAPVLIVPRVFSPGLCRVLRAAYDLHGGAPSGFMRDVDGKTVQLQDRRHKVRSDWTIADPALRQQCVTSIRHRLVPQIRNAFQFEASHLERHLVACYDAAEGGHFRAHRDNTTLGTAHRRFAVSLFLNTGEYSGGQLRFPEYGNSLYTAPSGGAVVFSCSMLHEAMPVTAGRRYMYLPFLYDEAAAVVRKRHQHYIEECPDSARTSTT